MKGLIPALILLFGANVVLAANEVDPVGIWTFDEVNQVYVQDHSRHSNHGVVRGAMRRGAGPWGRSIYFDGKGSHVQIPDGPQLRMTNAVTVDVWVELPQPALGHPQCVVDKGGERYRIQIESNGKPMFGLKAANQRADLSGGQLKPDTWHRITGVFKRPQMDLYLDCKKVASRTWDYDIGPGATLFFGAKSGVAYFMKGWLADVRIYNAARPPRPDDVEQFKKEKITMPEKKLDVQEADELTVDTGAIQFAFDSKGNGGLNWVKVGKKYVVQNNELPPLFASLIESETYDGYSDYITDARQLNAAYRLLSFNHKREGDAFAATTEAELAWPNDDSIRAELHWRAVAGSPHIRLMIKLTQEGLFRNRFLRELGVQLPLALNFRKRIVQGGDQGWQFNTRHFYQCHLNTVMKLMPEPEHNYWRYFMVEQESPTHFRVWRSEGADTAALTAQHGHQAPGWIAAYDQQGGALWAYRNMHQRSPKAVAADAEKSGLARVYLHPPTAKAIALNSPQAKKSVFSDEHRTDWVWFQGEFPFALPTRILSQAWGEERLASDPPARPKIRQIVLWDAPRATDDRVPFVIGGLPLPKDAIDEPNQVRLFKNKKEAPLQTKPLAYWPDKSIKWLLLIFPLDGGGHLKCEPGSGEGETLRFHVTLRKGGGEEFRLMYGKQVRIGKVASGLQAEQDGERIDINTGPLALSLTTGETWLRDVCFKGGEILRSDAEQPLAFVDFLRPVLERSEGTEDDYFVNSTHPTGALDPGPLSIDSIVLEENGPLRAMALMEGYTKSQEPQRVIIRVEAYAGRSWLRMFHSVEFLHKDPRRAFVRSIGLSLPLRLDPKASRVIAGAQDGPKQLETKAKTGILQRNALSYSLWRHSKGQRFLSDVEDNQRCQGWLSLADERGGCTIVVRNMWQEYPKEIVADPSASSLSVYLWPESHPLMDVRRYSNYPHLSQGESVSPDSGWVDKVYYPNHPFVGVSKTHELLFYFHDAAIPAEQIETVAADFQSPALVYVSPEWYASLGITIPYRAPGENFARMDANLRNVTDFWLFHQKIWAWYGMWDYGDVMHKFKGWGYGWILPPDELARVLKMPAEERYNMNLGGKRVYDYHTQQDWSFDNGRWGWGNTEGLPGLFLQMQYLRTGRRDIFFAVEAMARHTRDVDMRHDGRWFGKGTRHGVQHWSDGNHEERQTIHSEWRFHHYLTGDMRSRDFSAQLTERVYTKGRIRIHAAHSGRLYGLLTRWEMTGDAKLGEMLRKYVHCFITPEGIDVSPYVEFPEVKLIANSNEVNSGNMFFQTFGATHALLEYYELTHDSKLKDALIRMADYAVRLGGSPGNYRKVLTFAALHADDPTPYRDVLHRWVQSNANYHLFNMTSDTPKHWTGETAFLRPGVSGLWFWLNDVFYLMSMLDREPEPTAEQQTAFAEKNAQGIRSGFARESWQAEYDRPDLADYLRDRRKE